MIRLEIGVEIRHRGVMSLCAIEDKTAVVVVSSYRSVSRNPVRFKALEYLSQHVCGEAGKRVTCPKVEFKYIKSSVNILSRSRAIWFPS